MPNTHSSEEAGILVSELATDPDMAELVDMFIGELPERVGAIERTLNQQDFEALSSLAHQLKGSAGGYGFPTITDAAKAVEQTATTTRDLDQLATEVQELTSLCRSARARAPKD
jgi:HPt (histidine-containing phosphotransfer) domain-containing protein